MNPLEASVRRRHRRRCRAEPEGPARLQA